MDGAKYGRCSGESDRIGGSFSTTLGFFGVVKRDALVKSPPNRHIGNRRRPGILENTGCCVKRGMTKQGKSDLLQSRPKR